jgi:hypothetical protein
MMSTNPNDKETSKIPVHALRWHLSGTILEMYKETETSNDYKTIDLSKFDIFFRGVDSDGFLTIEILPVGEQSATLTTKKAANTSTMEAKQPASAHSGAHKTLVNFDYKRRRQHGDVVIPGGFSKYSEIDNKKGGKYTIYVNQRKHFLVKVETGLGNKRLHNLGELGNTRDYITRFARKFDDEWHDWYTRAEIKERLHDARMYDGQKLSAGLAILQKQGLITKRKDSRGEVYASVKLPEVDSDSGVQNETMASAGNGKKKKAHEK